MVQQLKNMSAQSPLEALLSGFTQGYVPARQQQQKFSQQQALQEQRTTDALRIQEPKLNMMREEKERNIRLEDEERESKFQNLIIENAQSPEQAQSLISLSEKYKNKGTPEQRLLATKKNYDKSVNNLNSIMDNISNKSNIGGLSDVNVDIISNSIKKLEKQGLTTNDINQRLQSSGISEYDIERINTPKSAISAINNIKSVSLPFPTFKKNIDKAESNKLDNMKLIRKSLKDGSSISLLYNKLKDNGYSDTEIQRSIQDASNGIQLSERQQAQIFNIRKERQSLLSKIMGR